MILDEEEKDYVKNTNLNFAEIIYLVQDLNSSVSVSALHHMSCVNKAMEELILAERCLKEAYILASKFFHTHIKLAKETQT